MEHSLTETIGMGAAIILPLFNIPLIMKIWQRRSSQDISLVWALGVWVCLIFMAPSGFTSQDLVWRTFSITNLAFFTLVVVMSIKYRKGSVHGKR